MKSRILRKIFAISLVLILFLSVSAETLAKLANTAAGATQSFGIARGHASEYLNGKPYNTQLQYKADGKTVYRIFAGTDASSGDFDTAIICLDKNKTFPKETSSNNGQYTSKGNLTQSNVSNKEALQWLVDNALIPEDEPEMVDQKIAEIFESIIESTKNDVNPVRVEDIKAALTKDDIMIALQIAAWSVTDGYTMHNLKGSDGTTESSLLGNSIFGRNKGKYIKAMVEYYKEGMTNHTTGNTTGTDPAFVDTNVQVVERKNEIFLGEYKLAEATKDYTINITFYDENNQVLEDVDYLILDGNTTSSRILAPTKEDLNGKRFFIMVDRRTKARSVKITLMPKIINSTSVGTVWTTDNENDQRLLSIEREIQQPQPVEKVTPFAPTTEDYEFDAALRKHISQIITYDDRMINEYHRTYLDDDNQKTRKPVAVSTPNSSINEYEYDHRKDPYLIDLGDDEHKHVLVVYTITVYNETDKEIAITSITDYLPPKGLKFVNVTDNEEDPRYQYNSIWVYNENNNSVSTNALRSQTIAPVSNGEIHCASVQIALDVTEEAKGRIVTNIAEISGYETNPAGGEDHDSGYYENVVRKKKVILPDTEEDWENYNGKDNPDDLSNPGYYYKGQEDDDDFEKIKVKGKMDIALRKNITHVNGKQVNPNRIGTIDTAPLLGSAFAMLDDMIENMDDELGATANYSADIKSPPVSVKAGDLVTYKIRLLNEGQIEAYASEVTDFLPDGLAFIPNYTDNITNGWVAKSGTGTLKSLAEVDVNNMVTDSSLSGVTRANAQVYVGPVTITSKKKEGTPLTPFNRATQIIDEEVFLQLTCLVVEPANLQDQKILRNISVISGYKDASEQEIDGDGTDSVKDNITSPDQFNESNHEDDEDYDDVIITKVVTFYDLALKKYITAIRSADGTAKTIPSDQVRTCNVVDVTDLVNRSADHPKANAVYSLGEKPKIAIEDGDIITYTIRIYNEGTQDALVKEVIDTVPKGLEFVTYEKKDNGDYLDGSYTNYINGWETFTRNGNGYTGWTTGIRTTVTNNENEYLLHAFDKTKVNSTDTKGLSYIELQVEFRVNLSSLSEEERADIMINGIVNIAEIADDDGDDNDSTPNNKVETEDDEDYDVVVPNVYDLALKKAVTEVKGSDSNPKTIPNNEKRTIIVDNTDSLKNRTNNGKANATYLINKTLPVSVADGDYVIYTIRVFNEGRQDAKVLELMDTIPTGLEFVEYEENTDGTRKSGSETNHHYKWKKKTNDQNQVILTTDYLSTTVIPAFDNLQRDGTRKEKGLSYEDVKIEFRVNLSSLSDEEKATIMKNGILNIAEITEDNGYDNDSEPGDGDPDQDDIDEDKIIPKEFDLALRKFIEKTETADEEKTYDRTPKATYKNGELSYSKEDDPVIVFEGTKITYVIRVYNEGSQDGYAAEVTDDIPKGLAFDPDDETNTEYRWKMYDENDKLTTDPDKAVKIKTDYLSKDNEKSAGGNLLKAFDPSKGITTNGNNLNPDYKDIKVVFWVNKSATEDPKILVNTAEISNDTDEYGNDVEDIDSEPGDGDPDEDDIDTELVEMKYFDLSLLKYVSKVIVIEDGVTKEIETGYTGLENPEPIVKIDLNSKKINTTEIKYLYTIKVTNEGEIDGYALEITDRIPEGLAFYEEDNTKWGWTVSEDGIVKTTYTSDQLLKPGQSTEVPIILRWVKDKNNIGIKINTAEISLDKNDYGVPDYDSTPNNNEDGEDDQDIAVIMLTIPTGSAPIYLTLIISVMSILGIGVYLIYKYVLKKE